MPVLGIETSCDETGLALVDGARVLGQRLATQEDLHALFGGVVPEIASRAHLRLIHPLFDALMNDAALDMSGITGVAVARGPGLLGSLLVGLGFAKGLAQCLSVPLVGVNHLHAHLLAPGLEDRIVYPAVGLLVSGGHTHIYGMKSPLEFDLMGRTLDDAAGECFDKVAKHLNLPYPGGRVVDEISSGADPIPNLFPRPYLANDNLDFSFSGLKTAVINHISANPWLRTETMPGREGEIGMARERRHELATMLASFSLAVAETLERKVERALARVPEARSLVVAGGVAANSMIRRSMVKLAETRGVRAVLPPPRLCTDNGLMIAHAGSILFEAGLEHDLDLDAVPRGRPVPDDYRKAA